LNTPDVAELSLGGKPCLFVGQSIGSIVRCALNEVEAHLLGHFGFRLLAAKQVTQAAGDTAQERHGECGLKIT
jgi:hypothetical protein